MLDKHLENYNYRLKLLYDNLKLNTEIQNLKKQKTRATNALNFSKDLNYDFLDDNNLKKWLGELRAKGLKTAILKDRDISAQILKKALNSNGIEIVFTSNKWILQSLTDEEMEKCEAADVIINADVHGSSNSERNGRKTIMLKDIIKGNFTYENREKPALKTVLTN